MDIQEKKAGDSRGDSTPSSDAPYGHTPYGSPRKSAYYALIGPSPQCEPADHVTALQYLHKIEAALLQGGWTDIEADRLRKLRRKWARRAMGRDKRFNLVGIRDGRLPADVEEQLGKPGGRSKRDTPHPYFIDTAERKRGRNQRRTVAEQDAAWAIDADLPSGRARGADASLDGDIDEYDPEAGEIPLPRISAARQYLIPGQDTKGHAHRVYCRIMPAHYRAMNALERSKVFGFRTVGDVMRWCIDYGVRELNARTHIPQAKSALAAVDAIREVLLDEQYYLEFPELFEQMTTTINRHLSSGAEKEAVRLIAIVRHQIEQMGEQYWREKFMAELMRHYASYIDGSRNEAVNFGGGE